MNKQKINMVGGGFQHEVCSSAGSIPKHIEWVKGDHYAPISIHIDYGIINQKVDNTKVNYAWLSESKTINTDLYVWVIDNLDFLSENFKMVFTHDESLLDISDIFKPVICNARPWVKDFGIHDKTKMVSMVSSNKNMCDEHKFRRSIVEKYKSRLDLYGRGYNPIHNKDIALKDYRFSVTIENGNYPLMYTEKITDCFAMGTIPIYWGCDDIGRVFDENGIIKLTTDFKPEELTKELYESKKESISNNYEITMNLPTVEDFIYETYIK